MPGNWNPNHPAAIGLEWLPTRQYRGTVSPGSSVLAMRLRSTQAEAVTGFQMNAAGDPSVSAPLSTIVDVYPAANLVTPAGVRTFAYLHPNADQDRGTWVSPGGLTTNLWSYIDDDPVYPATDTLYIRQSTAGTSAYRCWVDDSPIPANARICQVQARAVIAAQPNPTITTRGFAIRLQWLPTGDLYTPPGANFSANIYGQRVGVTFGEINPRTNLPWTRADVAQFNGGNWVLRIEGVGDSNTWAKIDALALLVDYLDVENRVAAGVWQRPSGSFAQWVGTSGLVSLPSGVTGWSKPASGDFAFVWRPANAPFATGSTPKATDVRWLGGYQDFGAAGQVPPPVPGMGAGSATVDAYGLVTAANPAGSVGMGLVFVKSGPSYSDDSQPYAVSSTAGVVATSTNQVAQRVRQVSGSSQNYLGVRFIVSPPSTGNSTLTVTVNATSGGTQTGGSFVITAEEARALPQLVTSSSVAPWRLVEGFLSSAATLANNTQYEIRFTASTADGWGFAAPDADGFASAGYRASTDSTRSGGVTLTAKDLAAVLLIQPTAPGAVAATKARWEPFTSTACGPGAMDQVVVSWTPTNLTTAFARYEVERLGQDGEWHLVAAPATEATSSWVDLEPPRNRASKYRVRVIATTAAFSDWVETEFVTPEQSGPEVVFTSNARPDLTVILHHEPSVPFTFPDHDTDESYLPYQDDGRVVFFDPVDRGTVKRYRLVVNFADIPYDEAGNRTGDDAIWGPLRRLTRATDVPYVAVLDSYGNVNYAHVALDNGDRDQPGDRYYVDATVTPVQFHPTAVT